MVDVYRIKLRDLIQRTDSSKNLAQLLDDPTRTRLGGVGETSDETSSSSSAHPSWLRRFLHWFDSPIRQLEIVVVGLLLILHVSNFIGSSGLFKSSPFSSSSSINISATSMEVLEPCKALATLLHRQVPISFDIHYLASAVMKFGVTPADISSSVPSSAATTSNSAKSALGAFFSDTTSTKQTGSSLLNSFLTNEVNPIIIRWVSFGLIISILLNVHLLRSVRASHGAHSVINGPAVDAAARRLWGEKSFDYIGNTFEDDDDSEEPRLNIRPPLHQRQPSEQYIQNQWTREDAEEFAREDKRRLESQRLRENRHVPDTIEVVGDGHPISVHPLHLENSPASKNGVAKDAVSQDADKGSLASTSKSKKKKSAKKNKSAVANGQSQTSKSEGLAETIHPKESVEDAPLVSRIEFPPGTASFVPEGEIPVDPRPLEMVLRIFEDGIAGRKNAGSLLLNDEEIIMLVQHGKLPAYNLEKALDPDFVRAISIRRRLLARAQPTLGLESSKLPFVQFDYTSVIGQCCENVIGYMPLPVGLAGPLRIDGKVYSIPMATTEGALVASTMRGCKALNALEGVRTTIAGDAMTRGPCIEFPSSVEAGEASRWARSPEGFIALKTSFESTSRYAKVQSVSCGLAGKYLYIRFRVQTGDAMGMNMISKGCEAALAHMRDEYFPDMYVVSLSGNYCTDKKPAAINWIEGRGKSVVAECIVPKDVVKNVLKTTVPALCKLNFAKNFIGSALAGTMGGNNAHAANIVAAIFIATGQDPAQVVESANCMTLMEPAANGEDLWISCTMPSIEVGTIGGGTNLVPQRSMLELLGVHGPHPEHPGENAQQLARIVAAGVMAGELSLLSALSQGVLVKSHMTLNRAK